jgi:hypothetical protein
MEELMDQYDLLKAHVDAFVRKDGTAVKAYETLASQARNTADKASRHTHGTAARTKFNQPAFYSHADAAAVNKQASYAHFAAAKSAHALGMIEEAKQHLGLANHHASLASGHEHLHKNSPNGVPSVLS